MSTHDDIQLLPLRYRDWHGSRSVLESLSSLEVTFQCCFYPPPASKLAAERSKQSVALSVIPSPPTAGKLAKESVCCSYRSSQSLRAEFSRRLGGRRLVRLQTASFASLRRGPREDRFGGRSLSAAVDFPPRQACQPEAERASLEGFAKIAKVSRISWISIDNQQRFL